MLETSSEITISNLSIPTTKDDLIKLLSETRNISNIEFDSDSRKAKISFHNPESALEFTNRFNHQAMLSNDLHISIFRNPQTKLQMRKWKLLLRNIKEGMTYPALYSIFEKYGPIHHISHYLSQKIASLQYFTKEAADNCVKSEQNSDFSILLAWPQFSTEANNQYIEIHYLPDNFDEKSLLNLLSKHGHVTSTSLLYYLPHHNKRISVAFASFVSRSQRQKAISDLDGTKINRKMIHVQRLTNSSCFTQNYSGDLSEFYYFIPIKGKHYLEFINPPKDLDETKLRGICGTLGHVYDVSVLSKCKGDNPNETSHVAFTTKGPLKQSLKKLSHQYEIRRLPKSSIFYHQFGFQEKESEDSSTQNDSDSEDE